MFVNYNISGTPGCLVLPWVGGFVCDLDLFRRLISCVQACLTLQSISFPWRPVLQLLLVWQLLICGLFAVQFSSPVLHNLFFLTCGTLIKLAQFGSTPQQTTLVKIQKMQKTVWIYCCTSMRNLIASRPNLRKFSENPQKNFEGLFFEIAARLAVVQQIDGKTNVQICKHIKSIFVTLLEQLRILCGTRDMAHRLRSTVLAYWFRNKSGHCGCSTAQVQPCSSETSSTESRLIQRGHTD